MPTERILSTGAIVTVEDNGAATFLRCSWLVRVANGNPEPDSAWDAYDDVDCGPGKGTGVTHPGEKCICKRIFGAKGPVPAMLLADETTETEETA